MEVLRLMAGNQEVLRQAQDITIEMLRKGGVVAVPTDTVYGLIADATNDVAVAKIFDIKGRPKEKVVSLFVRDIRMAKEYAEVSSKQERFLEEVWPGRITVVLKRKPFSARGGPAFGGDKLRTYGAGKLRGYLKDTIGMRAPKDVFLQNVLKEMAVPIAQTSANVSGKPPARNVEEVLLYFNAAEHQPDLVIDGGAREGEPSTVLDLSVAKPVVLREGAVSPETVFRWYTYFNG